MEEKFATVDKNLSTTVANFPKAYNSSEPIDIPRRALATTRRFDSTIRILTKPNLPPFGKSPVSYKKKRSEYPYNWSEEEILAYDAFHFSGASALWDGVKAVGLLAFCGLFNDAVGYRYGTAARVMVAPLVEEPCRLVGGRSFTAAIIATEMLETCRIAYILREAIGWQGVLCMLALRTCTSLMHIGCQALSERGNIMGAVGLHAAWNGTSYYYQDSAARLIAGARHNPLFAVVSAPILRVAEYLAAPIQPDDEPSGEQPVVIEYNHALQAAQMLESGVEDLDDFITDFPQAVSVAFDLLKEKIPFVVVPDGERSLQDLLVESAEKISLPQLEEEKPEFETPQTVPHTDNFAVLEAACLQAEQKIDAGPAALQPYHVTVPQESAPSRAEQSRKVCFGTFEYDLEDVDKGKGFESVHFERIEDRYPPPPPPPAPTAPVDPLHADLRAMIRLVRNGLTKVEYTSSGIKYSFFDEPPIPPTPPKVRQVRSLDIGPQNEVLGSDEPIPEVFADDLVYEWDTEREALESARGVFDLKTLSHELKQWCSSWIRPTKSRFYHRLTIHADETDIRGGLREMMSDRNKVTRNAVIRKASYERFLDLERTILDMDVEAQSAKAYYFGEALGSHKFDLSVTLLAQLGHDFDVTDTVERRMSIMRQKAKNLRSNISIAAATILDGNITSQTIWAANCVMAHQVRVNKCMYGLDFRFLPGDIPYDAHTSTAIEAQKLRFQRSQSRKKALEYGLILGLSSTVLCLATLKVFLWVRTYSAGLVPLPYLDLTSAMRCLVSMAPLSALGPLRPQ
jgi:hypothetical protein